MDKCMHEKYSVKQECIPNDITCKCGGKLEIQGNVIVCSINGTKCLELKDGSKFI